MFHLSKFTHKEFLEAQNILTQGATRSNCASLFSLCILSEGLCELWQHDFHSFKLFSNSKTLIHKTITVASLILENNRQNS